MMATNKMNTLSDTEKRELDAWIAEHVMGWTRLKFYDRGKGALAFKTNDDKDVIWVGKERAAEAYECDHPENEMFSPTKTRADAFEVLKVCNKRVSVKLHQFNPKNGGEFPVSARATPSSPNILIHADALELAICLFAKKLFEKGAPTA